MNQFWQTIFTSVMQALHELRANKLRTFLSLLGITIGIFCIIAVLTVLDSMKRNVSDEISKLGSDVLYVGRTSWIQSPQNFKWWEIIRRPSMTTKELEAVREDVRAVDKASLVYIDGGLTIKRADQEVQGIVGYATMEDYDKIQNINIRDGRYLSASEIGGGNNAVVLGSEVYKALFPSGSSALGKKVTFNGAKYNIVGVIAQSGKDLSGFDYDNSIIYPYYAAARTNNMTSLGNDPMLIIKLGTTNVDDATLEVIGALRRVRKVPPGEPDNFAVNRLSEISDLLDTIFVRINWVGWGITIISLFVGAFGIANIMFVTVKERTKIIGLKKAIGANSKSILTEFLIEAITLCVFGGLTGILFVFMLTLILTYIADFPTTLSIANFALGIGISAFVGILAGIIPAWSASRLNPVVAIRSN